MHAINWKNDEAVHRRICALPSVTYLEYYFYDAYNVHVTLVLCPAFKFTFTDP